MIGENLLLLSWIPTVWSNFGLVTWTPIGDSKISIFVKLSGDRASYWFEASQRCSNYPNAKGYLATQIESNEMQTLVAMYLADQLRMRSIKLGKQIYFASSLCVIVITFYSPSCFGQKTTKGPFDL